MSATLSAAIQGFRQGKLCVRLSPWQPVYVENKDPLELSDDDDKLAYRALTMCWALFWVLIRLFSSPPNELDLDITFRK